ncbi:hypothetical protein [Rubellimicrobium arenae]|uniref:hypothetical protein n=1 Tax=Rubellimicrobium arenae TaxID=2817372 RepID=UPI001FEF5926|nr:hypothetical protein [Rubellimicrobium arenae]
MGKASMARLAALAYAALAGVVILFHAAVIAGLPLGRLTMGGRWPGVLPWPARLLPLLSALLMAAAATTILARAQVLRLRTPRWAMHGVLALGALAVLANAATPSVPERLLWLPVTLAMMIAAGVVSKA